MNSGWPILLAAMLPGLLPVLTPVYEADVAALMARPNDHDFTFWLSFGRPLLYPLVMPFISFLTWVGLPVAAQFAGAAYFIIVALWLWAFSAVLALVLGSRHRGALAAAFVSLHFHFYEIRLWSGNNLLTGGIVALAGVWWVLAGKAKTAAGNIGTAAAAAFVALNLHQSSAFFLPAFASLCLAADILHRRKAREAPLSRSALFLVAGFAAALVTYAGEILLIRETVGLPPRATEAHWLNNLYNFAKRLPLWGAAVLPLPHWMREQPLAAAILALTLAWVAWSSPKGKARRKMRAAGVLAGTAVLCCLPTLFTDGSLSSRVLLPPLVVLWGGGAVFLSCWEGGRRAAWLRRTAFASLGAVVYVCHWWGFGLAVAVKHVPVNWTRILHKELAEAGVQQGDTIVYHGFDHETRSIAWSDSGHQIYGSSWGAEAMFSPIFSRMVLPENLQFQWAPGHQMNLDEETHWYSRSIFTQGLDSRWGVNGGGICLRQLEVEQRFRRAFHKEYAIGLGALAACSYVHPADGLNYRPSRTPETQFRLDQTNSNFPTRLVLSAIDLDVPYQLSATCRNLSPTVESVVAVSWYGKGPALVEYELTPGETKRLDLSFGRQSEPRFLVLSVSGRNGRARVQFTRAEIKYERERPVSSSAEPDASASQ